MKSVTQEDNFGCGTACIAFVLERPYSEVISILKETKVENRGFHCKDLVEILKRFGFIYSFRYLKQKLKRKIYKNGVIVFIKRSKRYPVGHYLVYHNVLWMDPWINFKDSKNIEKAKSGFRKRLPGVPIYALFPSK